MGSSTKGSSYGEPEEWQFDYPWDTIQTAFWLWAMSGFQRLPIQEEVMAYDSRYISDMQLAYQIYSHQTNDNAIMRLYEEYNSNVEEDGTIRNRINDISLGDGMHSNPNYKSK